MNHKRYKTSHNNALKNYTVELARDYISGSDRIMAILSEKKYPSTAMKILKDLKERPEHFERHILPLIRDMEEG